MRPCLFFARHLAGGHLIKKLLGAITKLRGGVLEGFDASLEILGIGDELISQRSPSSIGERGVAIGGWPQILFNGVPAGPILALLEIGFAQVEPGIKVTE